MSVPDCIRSWLSVLSTTNRAIVAVATSAILLTPESAAGGVTHPVYQYVSRYRDNLDFVVDRRTEPQLAAIGEVESIAIAYDLWGRKVRNYGTAVLISPCYIITNHHVAFGGEHEPRPGKDYSMLFRVGVPKTRDAAFLGNTVAIPAVWGKLGPGHKNDWAIMKLRTCVGARPNIGWFDISTLPAANLPGNEIAVAGFAGNNDRGELSFSIGKAVKVNPLNLLIEHSASASPGESGGAVLVRENGRTKLVGLHTQEIIPSAGYGPGDLYDTYVTDGSYSQSMSNSNEFFPLFVVMSRPDVVKLIDSDKAVNGPNPALRYMYEPWPTGPSDRSAAKL